MLSTAASVFQEQSRVLARDYMTCKAKKHSLSGDLLEKVCQDLVKSIINTNTNTALSNTIATSHMCQFEFKFN